MIRKIQEYIKAAQRRPLEFQVGDKVFLKVSPIKEVRRFNIKGKLSPRYIGPCEIIEKLNLAAYRSDLSAKLKQVHNVFHISWLKTYVSDPNHVIIVKPVEVAKNLAYEERHVQILDYRVE